MTATPAAGAEAAVRGRSPYGPTWNLGNPQPPRRRLEHPREGTEGGEVPWGNSGPTDESGGRDRRAPGETWSQLSEGVRVGLSRPLRVGSGDTSPPGVDPSRRQLDQRDLRRGGPCRPELDEEPAEGGGEPRTIERPRVRARFVDQGEPTRSPGEGRGGDPVPPPSPGESGTGSPPANGIRQRRRERRRGRSRKGLGGGSGPAPVA